MVTTRSQSQLKNKATASPQATKPAAKQPRKKQAPATEQQPPAEQPRPLSVKDRNAGMGGGQSKGASKPDSHPIASLPGSPAAGAAPAVGFPLPAGEASQEQQPAAAAAPEPAAPAAQEPVPAEQQPAPAAAERPLPQPKPLSRDDRPLKPLPAQPVACDKLPDGAEPVAVEVEYVPREALAPLEGDAAAALEPTLAGMESSDWVEATRALGVLRQLAAHHADVPALQLERTLAGVLKGVKNLRSSLCKTAIMAAADLFLTYADALLPLVDAGGAAKPATSLLAQLLLKAASNDKKFVVEEAQRALQTLAQSLNPAQTLPLLLPYCEHKNPKVRGRAAAVLEASAARLDAPALAAFGLASLLRPAAKLLTDNTPEAREAAKRLLPQLKAAAGDPAAALEAQPAAAAAPAAAEGEAPAAPPSAWEAFCQATLGSSAALAVLKAC